MNSGTILVANIGSTSVKFRLVEMPSERVLAQGGIERIGSSESPYKIQIAGGEATAGSEHFAGYGDALAFIEKALTGNVIESFSQLSAFGFKPVMARGISGTQLLEEPVLRAMEELNTLFPAHNPPYVAAVRAVRKLYPAIPCIGTFETAFYDRVPVENRRYPVPLEWEERFGIRRYGFHGASHRYVAQRSAELRGSDSLRIISCHLGGSSSIACIRGGWAIDSSWGMTPQSGLPQNNRVGDFDVFALLWLARDLGVSLEEAEKTLGTQAGLKGMSGLASGDLRDLQEAAAAGHENARIAIDVFVGAIRKFIGQFLVQMNGADLLVFTAGMGENSPELRAAVCRDLSFCGLELDPEKNKAAIKSEAIISTPASKIEVRVIPTNEELIIARNAWAKLSGNLI